MKKITPEEIMKFAEALKSKEIKIFKDKNKVIDEIIKYYSETENQECDIYEEHLKNTLDGEIEESFTEFVEKNYFDIVYNYRNSHIVVFKETLENETINKIIDLFILLNENKQTLNFEKICEELTEEKAKEMVKKYEEMNDIKNNLEEYKDIIRKIKERKIDVFNSRNEAINAFIKYYSENMEDTIFIEFARYIEEKQDYTENLIGYIEKEYSDRILETNGLYFLYYYDYLKKDEINKITILSLSKNKEELLEFCEKIEINMNEVLEQLIYEIKDGTTEIENSEQGAINTLIDRYSEDIFEEFLEDVRNDKYDMTFNQYMRETYSHKITKVDNLFFITFHDEGYDEETIRELLELSNTNDIDEIKKFCEECEVSVDGVY